MNAPFLHRSLTESNNTFLNGVLTSDIIYGDSGSFNFRNDIWTSQYEQVFPMLYSEGYAIHEHLAPFGLVYLKELTGYFAEGPDIGTSGFYNNLAIDDDLGNVNSSIETGCNTHRQTDWVRDKPGQEAYFDKNVTSKDDPDLKGRIYVGKTFIELRENNFLYYGDEKGDLYQDPRPIFGLKEDTREADGQEGSTNPYALATVGAIALAADDVTGIGAVDDIAIPFLYSAAATYDLTQRVYVTYTLINASGQKYASRASGFSDPYSILMQRYAGHHMKAFGYGNSTLDVWAQGAQAYPAIREREQQLIDFYGEIDNVGNSIRGVGYYNPMGRIYHAASNLYFDPLAPYTDY